MDFQQEKLLKETLVNQCMLSKHVLDGLDFVKNHLEFNSRFDPYLQQMLLQIRTQVLAKDWKEETEFVSVPADWWQAVRERWLPGFWVRRWPIRMRKICVRHIHRRMCPHLNIRTDNSHFMWLTRGDK